LSGKKGYHGSFPVPSVTGLRLMREIGAAPRFLLNAPAPVDRLAGAQNN